MLFCWLRKVHHLMLFHRRRLKIGFLVVSYYSICLIRWICNSSIFSFFLYMARFDHYNLFVLCCMHTTWIWWTIDFFSFVTWRVEESHYNLTLSKVSYKCLSSFFTHDIWHYACKVVRTCRYIVLKVEMILPLNI